MCIFIIILMHVYNNLILIEWKIPNKIIFHIKGVYRVSIVKRPLLSTLPFLLAFYNFKK